MQCLYLAAVVAANLSVAHFGPRFVVINTFVFIGFDLIARDSLHERWHNRNLARNMITLIAVGSMLSTLFSLNAARVAVASFLAFFCAGIADTLTYQWLYAHRRIVRMNGSNLPASVIDSVIFVTLAFGTPVLWDVIAISITAKIAGGVFWSIVFTSGKDQDREG